MLEIVRKKGKKVLIAIDEVVSDDNMKIFSNTFQLLLRKNLPVFLLMTGLYENISDLQNEKNVTFLLRTPKLELEPLNMIMMADCYRKQLKITESEALQMAELTKGYPFAFQVLGYLCYENHDSYQEELVRFDYYLSEYVYNKLWSELSEKDRLLTVAIKNSDQSTENIMALSGMKKNELSVYRDRLIKKGLVVGKTRGQLTFALPRFENFIETRE
jgi:hypothetical protein